jgi:hypothetical protein
MFWRLDYVSVFKWNLLSWAQSIELVPISGPDRVINVKKHTIIVLIYAIITNF